MAASTGPMHGVQPKAKATPSSSAPPGPGRTRSIRGRPSRIRKGARTRPMTKSPIRTIKAPATFSRRALWSSSSAPRLDAAAPSAVKTSAKPATKRQAAPSVRPREELTPDM